MADDFKIGRLENLTPGNFFVEKSIYGKPLRYLDFDGKIKRVFGNIHHGLKIEDYNDTMSPETEVQLIYIDERYPSAG
jgi:hypothetical protein